MDIKLTPRLLIAAVFAGSLIASADASHGSSPVVNISQLVHPVVRTTLAASRTYFVMTDRFADGDSTNNSGGLVGGPLVTGYDPTSPAFFHGGDFAGLTQHLSYIKGLGFTDIWITPPVKQKYVQGSSAAYHGYWGEDFTTIDPHLGSEADFANFVAQAHQLGLKVIMDIVVNHTADVIQYDASGKAFVPANQKTVKNPGWLNDVSNYHNVGDIGANNRATMLTGDFFGLDDLATEKQAVRDGWVNIWGSWIRKYRIDGFRIDTAQYVEPGFWNYFLPAIKKVAASVGIKDFPIYGEIADANPEDVAPFVTDQSFPSALDFPFQSAISTFAKSLGSANAVAALFNADDLYTTAHSSAYNLATFLGNHDMGRIGYFLNQSASWTGPEALLARDELAHALLFLLRGSPIVYYGDEKGMTGSGGDKSARQDMFSTQVSDWSSELRIGGNPIGSSSAFQIHNPLEDEITNIQGYLVANPELSNGSQQLRLAQGSLLATTRFANAYEYATVFNSGAETSTATFSVLTASSTWHTELGGASVSQPSSKSIAVTLPSYGYVLLKSENTYVAPRLASLKLLPVVSDANSQGWLPITAQLAPDSYANVSFSYRIGSGAWQELGTSDHTTYGEPGLAGDLYRVYFHPSTVRHGVRVEFIAVAQSDSGQLLASQILGYTV